MLITLCQCPDCGQDIREDARKIEPNYVVRCACGGALIIEEKDMPGVAELIADAAGSGGSLQ